MLIQVLVCRSCCLVTEAAADPPSCWPRTQFPQHLWRWYCACVFPLMLLRWIIYKKNKWHYFMLVTSQPLPAICGWCSVHCSPPSLCRTSLLPGLLLLYQPGMSSLHLPAACWVRAMLLLAAVKMVCLPCRPCPHSAHWCNQVAVPAGVCSFQWATGKSTTNQPVQHFIYLFADRSLVCALSPAVGHCGLEQQLGVPFP